MMTVAAVLLAASAEEALLPVEGRALVRRLVDAAWAGGAVPVIVVAADPEAAVAAALVGAPATLVAPGTGGISEALSAGALAATAEVAETNAVLAWPTIYAWVDPETVGSLIEAHGIDRDAILRPAFEGVAGWPVLLPLGRMGGPVEALLERSGPARLLDLGDPGATHDRSIERADLPPYRGPDRAPGPAHEWGSLAAEEPDASVLEGPGIAPLGGATDPD